MAIRIAEDEADPIMPKQVAEGVSVGRRDAAVGWEDDCLLARLKEL